MVQVPSELADRARKVIERFNEIKDYSDSFNLSENDGERRIVPDIRSVRQTSSFVYAPRIRGREQDKERVIQKLFSGEGSRVGGRISVLAIVGMGGLGKTTLAQLVYNDPRVRQSFDLCVSECFDVQNITREIISLLTQKKKDKVQSDHLQRLLAEKIQEKRVFLVLDDVWNERGDWWEMLCMPMFASTRCDIVVTTRNEAVARLVQTMPSYNLHCLSPDESWSLFKQTAFDEQQNVSPAANLVEIGKRVAEKCKGLPLALMTLGKALRVQSDEGNNENKWREVLESELWDLQQSQQEVLPALELSYMHMPIYLKRCFVALSLFPKASYLSLERVVWLWKLLGLIHTDGICNMDETGNLYFNELVERSLLQSGINEESVMHDLVHDLACFLAGEEFFRLDSEENNEVPQGARYMSIVPKALCKKSIRISNSSKSLRAIIMERKIEIENPEELFLNCNKFRVVHIEEGSIAKVLLNFLGGMKLLRHLTLGGYEDVVLSNSISHLFNSQTLNIGSRNLHGIGRLVNLHTLPPIHLCKCGCYFNIRELRNMNKVRELRIYGLCNVSSIREAKEAHLHSKKNLEILELDFDGRITCEHTKRPSTTTVSQSQLLESLRPHYQCLKVLRIKNLNHGNYPSWLSNASFPNLTELELDGCQSHNLPTLGELPALKLLTIGKMEHVEYIGREFSSHDQRFSSLVSLHFEYMDRLLEWSEVEDCEFPCLETLIIWGAMALRSLPSVPFCSYAVLHYTVAKILLHFLPQLPCRSLQELPALPSLWSLYVRDCPSLVTFGHFPLLTVLRLIDRFKDEIPPRLVNSHQMLEELSVSSHTLTSICFEPRGLPSLRKLQFTCPNLQYCDGLASLTSLKILDIRVSPQLDVPDSIRSQLEKLYTH